MKLKYIKKNQLQITRKFIKKNWFGKNHILSKKNGVIEYYYNFQNKKKINFIGFFLKEKLIGIAGLIKYQNWSKNISNTIYLAFIVKKKDAPNILNKLFIFLKKKEVDLIACSRFNQNIEGFYKRIGQVNYFKHLYIFNDKINEKISKNLVRNKITLKNKFKLNARISYKFDNLPHKNIFYPKKNLEYFKNRYQKNPFYDYFIIEIYNKDKKFLNLYCKEIIIKKSKIWRVIDIYGYLNAKFDLYKPIGNLLEINKIEYIDFVCWGTPTKTLIKCGFNQKKRHQLIPEYFEPYIKKNMLINLCIFKNNYNTKHLLIVKGDGDQDRITKIK